MAVDIDFLRRAYFAFDKPVPYVVQDKVIMIRPIMLDEAETFLASIDILQHDKSSSPSVEIIQMSYLEYLVKVVKPTDEYLEDKLTNILSYCGITSWAVMPDERGKLVLVDRTHDLTLSAKQFDELTKIILYQNILHYDDSYVNPEFKKTMELTDSVKNFNREFPTLERKMYIITAHTGLSKQEQMKMTFREHQGVFEECSGEVDFETTRAITMYAGKEVDHWIYPRKRGKYDGYITSMGKYKASFGGDGSVADVAVGDGSSHAEQLLQQNNL